MQRLTIEGRRYVLISEQRYEALRRLAALRGQAGQADPAPGIESMLETSGFDRDQTAHVLASGSFGIRLQRLRRCRELDQVELARLAGVSQTMVSNLENDKVERPSARAVHCLLDALGIPGAAAYLLMGTADGRLEPFERAADREPRGGRGPSRPLD
ncbi:MAG TPA: helix-turn-helix transcriptional regulator [Vicinamibacterales bacterium]|nr:helix-turn-helix transcriptional regulator [Vicinamibacterales bacterium]